MSSSLGSYVSLDTSVASTTATEDPNETATTEHFSGIEETIDRLYRMSWLIRAPSAVSQNAKATSFRITDDDGNDGETAFEEYAAQVVKHRCPEASPELILKLAKSIVIRRKRFLYRRHHQNKLSFESSERQRNASESTSGPLFKHSAPVGTTQSFGSPTAHTTDHSAVKAARVAPSATSASAFSHNRFHADGVFAQSVASTAVRIPDDRAEAFQPPPPPKVVPGSKEFECPYCYIMLPIKEARPIPWK